MIGGTVSECGVVFGDLCYLLLSEWTMTVMKDELLMKAEIMSKEKSRGVSWYLYLGIGV